MALRHPKKGVMSTQPRLNPEHAAELRAILKQDGLTASDRVMMGMNFAMHAIPGLSIHIDQVESIEPFFVRVTMTENAVASSTPLKSEAYGRIVLAAMYTALLSLTEDPKAGRSTHRKTQGESMTSKATPAGDVTILRLDGGSEELRIKLRAAEENVHHLELAARNYPEAAKIQEEKIKRLREELRDTRLGEAAWREDVATLRARLASPTLVELGELEEWLARPKDYFLRIHLATRDDLQGKEWQASLKEWNDDLEEVMIAWGLGDTPQAAIDALGAKLKDPTS